MGMLRPAMVVLRRWCGGFECAYFADCLRHVAVGSAIAAQLGSFRSNWRVARTGGWSLAVGDCGDALLPVALQSFGVAIHGQNHAKTFRSLPQSRATVAELGNQMQNVVIL